MEGLPHPLQELHKVLCSWVRLSSSLTHVPLQASRSDLSSSPSLTFSSSSSQSIPHTPPTPRTPARYPTNLSVATTQLRPSRGNVSPKSGKPYQYQSLEDLLRVNGYRETRVFTPESERITSAAGASAGSSPNARVASRDGARPKSLHLNEDEPTAPSAQAGPSTVGGMVVSLLSGLIPGTTLNSGRTTSKSPDRTADRGQVVSTTLPRHDEPEPESAGSSPKLKHPPLGMKHRGSGERLTPPSDPQPLSRGSPVPRTSLTNALESALRKAQQPRATVGRAASSSLVLPTASIRSLKRVQSTSSPVESLTPSSSSSTIRPSPAQRLFMQQQQYARQASHAGSHEPAHGLLAPPIHERPNLRHIASAPNVGRSKARLGKKPSKSSIRPNRRAAPPNASQNRDGENWFENLSHMLAHVAGVSTDDLNSTGSNSRPISRTASQRSTKPGRNRAATSASRRPPSLVLTQHFSPTPVSATVTSVKADSVVCRSAPPSRAASQSRGDPGSRKDSVRRGKKAKREPLGTPLLSPSIKSKEDDPFSGFWETVNAERADGDESMDDSDTDPPNLEAILSTYLKNTGTARQGDASSTGESDEDGPGAGRKRSIRSLKAHLASNPVRTATPGVNGVPALPTTSAGVPFKRSHSLRARSASSTPEPGSADFTAWLGGSDWESGSKRGRGSVKKKRGLLPEWLSPRPDGNKGIMNALGFEEDDGARRQ